MSDLEAPEARPHRSTSGIEIRPVYRPSDLEGRDPAAEIAKLRGAGIDISLNIVGFAIDEFALEDQGQWHLGARGGGDDTRFASDIAGTFCVGDAASIAGLPVADYESAGSAARYIRIS